MTGKTAMEPQPLAGEETLTMDDVARVLRVTRRTVQRRIATGEIPQPMRHGGRLLRWPSKLFRAWLDDGCPVQS